MRVMVGVLLVSGVLLLVLFGTALYLVGSTAPEIVGPQDVFGFADLDRGRAAPELPELQTYTARDGAELAYRFYDSDAQRLLIFVHGSSYHGAGYHDLALHLSRTGAAKVATPNLRGHYMSGPRRGDVDYIGQLEDDIQDLIESLRGAGHGGPITLGGHSSGGGFVIRFAGGEHGGSVSSLLLLSPVVPTSSAIREGTAGGWASLHQKRLFGLLAFNAFGFHGLDGLSIIAFNKPERFWDGTETLAYSYRLNASYHPRYDYAGDIRAAQDKPLLVLIGAEDEAVDPDGLRSLFSEDPETKFEVLPETGHFAVFSDPKALDRIADWLGAQ